MIKFFIIIFISLTGRGIYFLFEFDLNEANKFHKKRSKEIFIKFLDSQSFFVFYYFLLLYYSMADKDKIRFEFYAQIGDVQIYMNTEQELYLVIYQKISQPFLPILIIIFLI